MGKKVKSLMNIIKKNNRGFSMIELLTAIAILGILAGLVGYLMNTSSKTYTNLSVEAQLQSEAQIVANMITELAIDSYDAQNDFTENIGAFSSDSGQILVLDSVHNNVKKQYVICKKTADNELYMLERTFDATSSSWGAFSNALLGEYIVGFNVDTSRVEKDNILQFTLSYKKNNKVYDGNYQVLMRNRAYADKEPENQDPNKGAMLSISVDPNLVYVDIVNDQVPSYYLKTIADESKRTVTAAGVPFKATVFTNQGNDIKTVNWEIQGGDENIFNLSATDAETTNLQWGNKTKLFKDSPTDSFNIVATKTITLSDGETTLDAAPKTARVLLRRIKSLSLYALSGATQWKEEYTSQYGGVTDSEAQGYAYVGTNGKYQPLHINAAISASNIAYGGGLTWKIYMKNSAGAWGELSNSSLAELKETETTTSTSNVVNFGSGLENGQVFKVEATSVFDPSFKASYVFGVAPTGNSDGDGFYSRGYYTDMGALLKGYQYQSDSAELSRLVFLKVTKVDASDNVGISTDKIKVAKDANGNWRLFVDYEAFAYSGDQKNSFYTGQALIHITIGYYDEYGNLCMDGQAADTYKAELEAQEGRSVHNGKNEDGKNCYNTHDVTYSPKPVKVTKVAPTSEVLVLGKGKTQSVTAHTAYYNLLSPRNGMYYLGAYLDDVYNNLLEEGKASTNAYFEIGMSSAYGDTNKYVDSASIQLRAKALSAQKRYLTEPMIFRIAATDFYLIKKNGASADSYTDYKVLIANVEGSECYIAGPEAAGELAWGSAVSSAVEAGTKKTVSGQNANGDPVTATVYKKNNKYYCEYGGRTYTYNPTYNFWAN